MGGLFLNGINRKYCCGFGCGCGALTIGAATDAASVTAATTIIVTDVEIIKVTPKQQEHKTEAQLMENVCKFMTYEIAKIEEKNNNREKEGKPKRHRFAQQCEPSGCVSHSIRQ